MTDLFLDKIDEFKNFLRTRRYHRSSDIVQWGASHNYIRANRTKQELVDDGFLRKLSEDESDRLFGTNKQGIYECMEYTDRYLERAA